MNFRIQNLDSQVGLKTFKYYCIIRAPATILVHRVNNNPNI